MEIGFRDIELELCILKRKIVAENQHDQICTHACDSSSLSSGVQRVVDENTHLSNRLTEASSLLSAVEAQNANLKREVENLTKRSALLLEQHEATMKALNDEHVRALEDSASRFEVRSRQIREECVREFTLRESELKSSRVQFMDSIGRMLNRVTDSISSGIVCCSADQSLSNLTYQFLMLMPDRIDLYNEPNDDIPCISIDLKWASARINSEKNTLEILEHSVVRLMIFAGTTEREDMQGTESHISAALSKWIKAFKMLGIEVRYNE